MEENGDDHSRLLLSPMVKAAVLAMNATNDILHEETCGQTQLSEGSILCADFSQVVFKGTHAVKKE